MLDFLLDVFPKKYVKFPKKYVTICTQADKKKVSYCPLYCDMKACLFLQ